MKTKKAGFTLVELLVVIAVIAILMAILMPVLRKAKEGARRVLCGTQCKQIHVAMCAYIADYEGKLPWYGDELHPYAVYRKDGSWNDEGRTIEYWDDKRNKGVPMKFACLHRGKYMPEPKVFYCPSNRTGLYKYKSYTSPEPWGSLPQAFNTGDETGKSHNQWVRIGYTYYPTSPWTKKNIFTGAPFHPTKSWDRLDPRIPFLTDVMRHKDELSHKTNKIYGLHALFKDGHVVYCNDQRVFNDPIWDEWEGKELDDADMRPKFYYTVFKLIRP